MSEKKNDSTDEVNPSTERNERAKELSPESLEELLRSEAFNAFVKEKGLKEFMGLSQALKASYEFLTKSASQNSEPPANTSDLKDKPAQEALPVWAERMKEKLDTLEKEKEREGKRQSALSLLASSGLPKALQSRWASRIDLDKEIRDQVNALEGEWADIQKQTGLIAGAPLPLGKSSRSDKPEKEEIEKIIARL